MKHKISTKGILFYRLNRLNRLGYRPAGCSFHVLWMHLTLCRRCNTERDNDIDNKLMFILEPLLSSIPVPFTPVSLPRCSFHSTCSIFLEFPPWISWRNLVLDRNNSNKQWKKCCLDFNHQWKSPRASHWTGLIAHNNARYNQIDVRLTPCGRWRKS